MGGVEWGFDATDVDNHFSFRGGLDKDTVMALEAALVTIFQATQANVHVISGRLKASGRIESTSDDDSWEGVITYGGPESGVNYAWVEMRRGESHDFLQVTETMEEIIGIAFRTGLDD